MQSSMTSRDVAQRDMSRVPDERPAPSASLSTSSPPLTSHRSSQIAGGSSAHGSAPPPPRPTLKSPNAPPVVIKQPPPFSVRLTQLLWVLSFLVGLLAVGFLVAVREDQLPLISEAVREVDGSRADSTYTTAADVLYWTAFGAMVTLLLVQITMLVSFMSRRRGVRWWQFGTFVAQLLVLALVAELVARGDNGISLRQMMTAQAGLALLALLTSTFPGAIAWSARQHDIRRGPIVNVEGTEL